MAINFPDSPTNGDTTTLGGKTYTYDSTSTSWTPSSAPAAAGTTVVADLSALLALTGMSDADTAFVTDTKASYMWDGVEWQRMSMGNQLGPRYTTAPTSSLALEADGTTSDITTVAVDDSGFPVTYDWDAYSGSTLYSASSLPPQLTGVSESNGVFTLTPSTTEANAGDFSFRVKASDGVLTTPATSSISLAFRTVITIASRQTRGTEYVEPTSTGVTLFWATNASSADDYLYFPEGATTSASGMPTGKRYIEAKWTSSILSGAAFMVGIAERTTAYGNLAGGGYLGSNVVYVHSANGNHYGITGSGVNGGLGAYVLNDVWQIAYDTDAGKVWMGKNDTWSTTSGDPGAGGAGISLSSANEGYAFVIASGTNSTLSSALTWGGEDYTKPTGFSHF
jgi:hypothetical protein